MDNLTPEQRRKNMQNIHSADTKVELFVARELRKRKIYFARNVRSLFGKPDFVFRRKKIAVFIDSDFWHGHPKRCIMPKSNRRYWNSKIKRNKERDRKVNKVLKNSGWIVLRIWEYDLSHYFNRVLGRIIRAVKIRQKYGNKS
jgi:DNA mismatch endonuclease, patch repair protein